MPGPLTTAWDWANKPVVPPSEAVDKLAQPGLDDSPTWAKAKGFASGALEGLRKQSSPLNMLGLATMAIPGAGAIRGARAAEEGSEAVLGLSKAILGLSPKRYTPVTETLGELLPEYAPVGGEAMYNVGRGAIEPVEKALSPFKQMQQSGVFQGDRTTGQFKEGPGGLTDALKELVKMR